MANEKVISTQVLIEKFQYALDVKGGYIWGTAGEMWTAAKQAAATRTMTVKYGKKWIGHRVWDCSGLFSWAFKELGGYMYHGSDTMFRKYTTASGALIKGKRSDGAELKPGTAVFTYNEEDKKYGHVGLYIGDGKVIEAAGTKEGVITSKVNGKWEYWGELKGVDYGSSPQPTPTPVPAGKAIVTGKSVALRAGPSTETQVLKRIATGTTVDIAKVDGWTYVKHRDRCGFMMNEFIQQDVDMVTVTGRKVAMREGPGTDTRVIARISTGDRVPKETIPDDWEYVAYNGKKGFMMNEFIREG